MHVVAELFSSQDDQPTQCRLKEPQNPTGYAQVVEELQKNAQGNFPVVRSYTWGTQVISKLETASSTPSFYGFDGHGSVRYLTDNTGAVTDTYDYDAFGNLLASTGTTTNNYRFAGEQLDPDLGLYYNRARYLDVRGGRFWTMDTAEPKRFFPKTIHRYLYASGNPVDRIDISGLDDIEEEEFAGSEEESIGATESSGAQQIGTPAENLAMDASEEAGEGAATQTSNTLGRAGENFVSQSENLARNSTERIPSLTDTAEYRIPDFLDKARQLVGEAKNVRYLRLTPQLLDYLEYAKKVGFTLYLFVRAGDGTQLSGDLEELEAAGEIIIKRVIPPTP